MGLPLSDCLSRGLANLTANWQLVPLFVAQRLLVGLLVIAGLLPPLVAVGVGVLTALLEAGDPATALEILPGVLADLASQWLPIALGVLASLLVWTAAFVVFCYFQGGLYGVLAEADRRTPRGADWRAFAVFSAGLFHRQGRRLVWRYFWLLNLFAVLFTLLALALLGGLGLLGVGLERAIAGGDPWRAGLLGGVGCAGALAFIVPSIALAIWMGVAQAEAAREGVEIGAATRRSLRVLFGRLPAVLGVFALAWVASMAVGSLLAPLWLFGVAGWARHGWLFPLGADVALAMLQWVLSGVVSLALAAVLVTLVRGEAAEAAS